MMDHRELWNIQLVPEYKGQKSVINGRTIKEDTACFIVGDPVYPVNSVAMNIQAVFTLECIAQDIDNGEIPERLPEGVTFCTQYVTGRGCIACHEEIDRGQETVRIAQLTYQQRETSNVVYFHIGCADKILSIIGSIRDRTPYFISLSI